MKNDTTHDATKRTAGRTTDGQSVRIMGFVDGDVIPPACYDRPYRLEPEKDEDKAYDVLREAMHRTHKVGLASVVIERKQALAAVIPIGRTLVLNVLRFATGLMPRANRGDAKVAAQRQQALETALAAAPEPPPTPHAPAVRKRAVPTPETIKAVARMAPVKKRGEVIDLAVRRSSKRAAQPRAAKAPRARGNGVATLHELRRKPAGRSLPSRQLA